MEDVVAGWQLVVPASGAGVVPAAAALVVASGRRVREAMVLDIRPVVLLIEAAETVVVTDGGAVEVTSGA